MTSTRYPSCSSKLAACVASVLFALACAPAALASNPFDNYSNPYYWSEGNIYFPEYAPSPGYLSGHPGNCTWYAYGRLYEMSGEAPRLASLNACEWWDWNIQNGSYEYGQTPRVGAVACFADNHVSVVEAVDADGTVHISESSYSMFDYRERTLKSSGYPDGSLQGYIYVVDVVVDPPASPEPLYFSDTFDNAWYIDYVGYVSQVGLMTGYSGTDLFGPEDSLTRGQVATILYRYANPGADDTYNPGNYGQVTSFADVEPGMYYTSAIEWCRRVGVVTGYQDGSGCFGPNDYVSREQLATMLYRFAQLYGFGYGSSSYGSLYGFPDAGAVSPWAQDGLGWCNSAGILTGSLINGTAYLMPANLATRAQMAKMITVLVRDNLAGSSYQGPVIDPNVPEEGQGQDDQTAAETLLNTPDVVDAAETAQNDPADGTPTEPESAEPESAEPESSDPAATPGESADPAPSGPETDDEPAPVAPDAGEEGGRVDGQGEDACEVSPSAQVEVLADEVLASDVLDAPAVQAEDSDALVAEE